MPLLCTPYPFPRVTHHQSNLVYRLIALPSLAPLTQPRHSTHWLFIYHYPLPSSSAGIPSVLVFFLRRHAAVPGRQCLNRPADRLSQCKVAAPVMRSRFSNIFCKLTVRYTSYTRKRIKMRRPQQRHHCISSEYSVLQSLSYVSISRTKRLEWLLARGTSKDARSSWPYRLRS